jgi:cytochrome c1
MRDKEQNMNDLVSALLDMYDVRNALSEEALIQPKDNDGTEITVRECLDDVIEFLEAQNEEELKRILRSTYSRVDTK